MRKRKLQVLGEQLSDIRTFDILRLRDLDNSDNLENQHPSTTKRSAYMYGTESSTMSSSHILIQRLNGQSTRHIAVFLVHIVCSGTRIITEPNSVILDSQGSFLRNLVPLVGFIESSWRHLIHGNDFAAGLFDFSGLLQKVPETRFCDLGVGCKDAHSIELGSRVVFGGELAPNDLVLMETRHVCFVRLEVGDGERKLISGTSEV